MSAKTKGFMLGLAVGMVASWAWHNQMMGGSGARPPGQ